MAASIAHRGPDGEGFFVAPGRPSVGLLNRRLAVIDIPGGAQPMSTEDGAFTLVYNGELWNALELRRDLGSRGHRFRSRCDTEVVLRGYAQWGRGLLDRLNGMWAFAVWERQERRLLLCRDRLGIKPLAYADTPQGFVFASEIKALLASGLVGREFDATVLPHYLSAFVVPEPLSFFRGVRRLPAGHLLTVSETGVREEQYWDCAFEEEQDRGLDAYREEMRGLLTDSVQRRLVSDVPLGVFLSGGVDSTLLAALAAKATSEPLRTFTLGFEGSSSDERPAARRTAAALGARHTEDVVTAREAAVALPDLLAAHDEPSQSLLQGHFISRLARRQVTVVLSGLGGDELFSSYPTHRAVDLLARLDRVPAPVRGLALSLARLVGGPRGRRLAALANLPADARVSRWLLHQTDGATRASLLARELRASLDLEAPARHLEAHLARARARHPLNRLLYVYAKTYLTDELLRTTDSMSMLHSLETRVPLLDFRLVELAMRMPAHHKMSLFEGKVLLRRVAEEVLPPGLVSRGKRGFSLPFEGWLRREMTESIRDVVSEAAIARRAVFDPETAKRLVDRCLDGEARLVPPVMMLFSFELWARRVLDQAPALQQVRPPEIEGPAPALSVIIVNWNTRDILRDCLASVAQHLGPVRPEVLVVDNASSDGSAEMVATEFPQVCLIRNSENTGFARANNQAMAVARGGFFLLLNSDTLLTDDSVARLFTRLKGGTNPPVAHCRLLFPDGRVQQSTYRFPSLKLALLEDFGFYKFLSPRKRGEALLAGYWDHDEERDVDWVAGAFMLLPRAVYQKTGGFSEAYFMYGEDMEWCFRIREAGWSIRYFPGTSIVHLDHSSAAIRWGDKRIAICIERQLSIFDQHHGRAWGAVFHLVRTLGMLIKVGYFSLRSLAGGANRDYYREMLRYYRLSLKVHASLLASRR